MNYKVKFQTDNSYKSIPYGQGTIYSSACGPASLCNALHVLGIADISIPTMCNLAVSCRARVEGGTLMLPLLKAAAPKYHFQYTTTSKNAELLEHLKKGGAAILHGGNTYKLFSNSGHFVTAAAANGNTITILDSYWYNGKYTANAIRRNYVNVLEKGIIQTSLTQCGNATIDRSPSYYLISRQAVFDKNSENKKTKEDDDEMVEKTKFRINGKDKEIDAITKNGVTYVSLRSYDEELGLITNYQDGVRVVDMPGVPISFNGVDPVTVPGMNIDGTTVGGVRAVLEAAGYAVDWDDGIVTANSVQPETAG